MVTAAMSVRTEELVPEKGISRRWRACGRVHSFYFERNFANWRKIGSRLSRKPLSLSRLRLDSHLLIKSLSASQKGIRCYESSGKQTQKSFLF
jgi:hypothetical protein